MSKFIKQQMVGWYDVGQLLNTAGKTIISTLIGENADQRLTNASLTTQPVYDYSFHLKTTDKDFESNGDKRKSIWIDYVADVGDGWNSTYSVAYNLARKNLWFDNEITSRGEILIFGGDEVYPTGNQREYFSRLIEPYRMAFESSLAESSERNKPTELTEHPHVFAVPGNHDWYDSLTAFRYLFCARYFNERLFAGYWRTRQRRSYFAIKLPYDWWIFGIDLQLTHTIDWAQLEYFKQIIENTNQADKSKNNGELLFNKGSKVILCSPEPLWVEKEKYKKVSNETSFDEDKLNLKILEKMVYKQGSEVKLYLAGDSHHYRRFEEITKKESKCHKITAGGGGAFLHPTHDIDFDIIDGPLLNQKFHLEEEYPKKNISRTLSWRNLRFLAINRRFGLLSGGLYCAVIWLMHSGQDRQSSFGSGFLNTINGVINNPLALLVIALLLFGLIFFTDSQSNWQKYGGGLIHGVAHLAAIFFIGLGSFKLFQIVNNGYIRIYNEVMTNILWFLLTIPITFLAGWIIGSVIIGLYLLISLNCFGRHSNEAFSSLKIEDFKCFLRLHLTENALTIYPFAIDRVSGSWESKLNLNEVCCYKPTLDINPNKIEPKITIKFK